MGFFIWLIFINKLNVMSIEKIRERIKMIEENNFEINELTGTVNINPNKLDTATKNIPNIKGYGQKLQKDFTKAGAAQAYANKARQTIAGAFNNDVNVYVGSNVKLQDDHNEKIEKIYALLKTNNALPKTEVDLNTLVPIYGYSQMGDSVRLKKSGYITIHFDDDRFTNLIGMTLDFKINKIGQQQITNIENELNNNKNSLNINNVINNQSNIQIEFN